MALVLVVVLATHHKKPISSGTHPHSTDGFGLGAPSPTTAPTVCGMSTRNSFCYFQTTYQGKTMYLDLSLDPKYSPPQAKDIPVLILTEETPVYQFQIFGNSIWLARGATTGPYAGDILYALTGPSVDNAILFVPIPPNTPLSQVQMAVIGPLWRTSSTSASQSFTVQFQGMPPSTSGPTISVDSMNRVVAAPHPTSPLLRIHSVHLA